VGGVVWYRRLRASGQIPALLRTNELRRPSVTTASHAGGGATTAGVAREP
jgi:hypothetical protein